MPFYNGGAARLESGNLYASSMQPIPRVTSLRIDISPPRANVEVLNRGKPLAQRPVINYTPVDAEVSFYHSDSSIAQMLGLVNGTGIIAGIIDTKSATATLGIRSMQVLFAPTNATNYNGMLDLKSGVLTSYALQGSVGDPVQGSFGLQFLDYSGNVNLSPRDTTNIAANVIKPEGMSLTGILFSGFGLTGVTMQSFAFSAGLGRTAVQQLGTKFPIERPITSCNASLQCQGWFDGINNSFTGLSMLECGDSMGGTIGLTLSPACGATSPNTITIRNPYFGSLSLNAQVGGFTSFSFSMDMPLGPNPSETGDGSVVTIT